MQNIDVGQVKRVLTAEKSRRFDDARRLHDVARSVRPPRRRRGEVQDWVQHELDRAFRRYMPDAARYFSGVQEDFRRGLWDRRRALDVLGTVRPPATPAFTTLDTPFLIWGLRNGTEALPLNDVHYEAGASWVKFFSHVKSDSDFFVSDEVNFYFYWQNAATDAVVNVRSFLLLAGYMQASAEPGWLWSPLWGASTIGHCRIVDEAHLTVLQWWEQPPTQPLPQADQTNQVGSMSVSGGWGFFNGGSEPMELSGSTHVAYDTLWVPANGVVVLEVGLRMHYSGYDGEGWNTFQSFDPYRVVCPQVQLEILVGAPVVHP